MKSVLLIRLGGLGDLLVAYPSIALIHKILQKGSGGSDHAIRGGASKQSGTAGEISLANAEQDDRGKLGAGDSHAPELILACRAEYGILLKEAGVVDEVIDAGSAAISGLFGGSDASSARSARDRDIGRPAAACDFIAGWMQSEKTRAELEQSLPSQGRSRVLLIDSSPCSGRLSRFFFDKTSEFLTDEGFGPLPAFEECSFLRAPSSWLKAGREMRATIVTKPGSPSSKKLAVVHPGSGSASKRWPLANFAEVVNRLAAAGVSGFLATGEAEEDLLPSLKSLALPASWRWIHQPPLRALAGLLSLSSLYLGNDSGVTHLAAVCGASGAAIFLRDLELRWAPYGRIRVVSEADTKNISTASIWKICCRFLAID